MIIMGLETLKKLDYSLFVILMLFFIGGYGITTPDYLQQISGNYVILPVDKIAPVTTFTVSPSVVVMPDDTIQKLTITVPNRRFIWYQYYIINTDMTQDPPQSFYELHEFVPLAQTTKGTGWILNTATVQLDLTRSNTLTSNNYAITYSCVVQGTGFECNNNKWGSVEFNTKAVDLSVDAVASSSGTTDNPIDVTITVTTNNDKARSLDPQFNLLIDWENGATTKGITKVEEISGTTATALTLSNGVLSVPLSIKDFPTTKTITKNYKVIYSGSARIVTVKANLDTGAVDKPNFNELDTTNNEKTKQINLGIAIPPVNYFVKSLSWAGGYNPASFKPVIARTGGATDDLTKFDVLFDFDSPNKNAKITAAGCKGIAMAKDATGMFVMPQYSLGALTEQAIDCNVEYSVIGTYSPYSKLVVIDTTATDNEKTAANVVISNYQLSSIVGGNFDYFTTPQVKVTINKQGDLSSAFNLLLDFNSPNSNTKVSSVNYKSSTGDQPLIKDSSGMFVLPSYSLGTKTTDTLIFDVVYDSPGKFAVKAKFLATDFSATDNELVQADAVTITEAPTAPQTLASTTTSAVSSASTTTSAVSSASTTNSAATVASPLPVTQYTFDLNAQDSIGTNHGTLSGTVIANFEDTVDGFFGGSCSGKTLQKSFVTGVFGKGITLWDDCSRKVIPGGFAVGSTIQFYAKGLSAARLFSYNSNILIEGKAVVEEVDTACKDTSGAEATSLPASCASTTTDWRLLKLNVIKNALASSEVYIYIYAQAAGVAPTGYDYFTTGPAYAKGKTSTGSLSLDGYDDWVKMTNTNPVTASFSVETVLQRRGKGYAGTDTFVIGDRHYTSATDNRGFYLGEIRATASTVPNIGFYVYNNAVCGVTSTKTFDSLNNQWAYLAGTFDGSKASLYINGVLEATTQCSFTAVRASDLDRFVGKHSEANAYFNGLIDDLKIYKIALSPTDVLANCKKAGICA